MTWRNPLGEAMYGHVTAVAGSSFWFRARGDEPYSFRQTSVSASHRYTPDMEVNLGSIAVSSRFVVAQAADTHDIPFYLLPSLGGSDLSGNVSLRSYPDFRFRDRAFVAASLEYERAILDWPLGVVAFLDAGQVGARLSDLSRARLRWSRGLGVSLRIGNLPVFQAFYAWGDEGSRVHLTGTSNPVDTTFSAVEPF